MSDDTRNVAGQQSGQIEGVGSGQPEQPDQQTGKGQPLTAEALEQRLAIEREQFMEFAKREAQSASDKRFARAREEAERTRKLVEQVGMSLTPEQLQQIQANQLLSYSQEAQSDQTPPSGQTRQVQPQQAVPDHILWAWETLEAAGVPRGAPEVDFNDNDPQFAQKVIAVAAKYSAGKQPQQASPQATPPANAQVVNPTPASAGTVSGASLEDQYRAALNAAMAKDPYMNADQKMRLRRLWRDKGANI